MLRVVARHARYNAAGAIGRRNMSLIITKDSPEIYEYPPAKTNTLLNIAQKAQIHVVERLGRFHTAHTSGLYVAIPLIDRVVAVVDEREMVVQISPQHAITKDNVTINLSGVVCVRVSDPMKFTYNIQRPLFALINLAESSMRAECGKLTLDELLHTRATLNKGIQHAMAHTEDNWGVAVLRYEVTDILPDERVSKSLNLQSLAEREKRQEIIKAEGDRQAQQTRAEGEAYDIERQASANATAIKLDADARAYAIAKIAEAINCPMGKESMRVDLAKEYFDTLSKLGDKSRLIMIPEDASDVTKMISRATAVASDILGMHDVTVPKDTTPIRNTTPTSKSKSK